MSALEFLVSRIPEDGLDIDETLSEEDLRPREAAPLGLDPVRVHGRISELGGAYLFEGLIEGAHRGISDWTGEEATDPFALRVSWCFVEGDPGDEDDFDGGESVQEDGTLASTHAYTGECLALAPVVWEEIVLSRPMTMPWQSSAASGLGMDLAKEPYVSGNLGAEDPSPREKPFGRLAELFEDSTPRKE